jgi:hypothetical protein
MNRIEIQLDLLHEKDSYKKVTSKVGQNNTLRLVKYFLSISFTLLYYKIE